MLIKDQNGILNEKECKLLNENLIHRINTLRSALIVVDFQNDFVSGALSIKVIINFKYCKKK